MLLVPLQRSWCASPSPTIGCVPGIHHYMCVRCVRPHHHPATNIVLKDHPAAAGHCCDGTSKGCTFKTDTPVSKSVCKCDTHYSGDDCSTHCDPLTGKCANINTNVCHLPPLDTRDHCTFPPNHHEAYDNCDRCTSVSGCVWCPGCPGNEPNHPRCVTDKGGKSCGLMDTSIMLFGDNSGKSRTCKSQCTEETCPVNSLCTDGANGKSICTCKPGYFAPPVAKKGHELPSQCVPRPAQGGLVAHVCQDYGNPSDALANW